MPLWAILLLGAGALYLVAKASSNVAVAIPAGAASYKIAAGGTAYYQSDPSLGTGALGGAVAQAGTLPAGTLVYSSTGAGANPILSSDQAYELIIAPGVGKVYVSIAGIVVQ